MRLRGGAAETPQGVADSPHWYTCSKPTQENTMNKHIIVTFQSARADELNFRGVVPRFDSREEAALEVARLVRDYPERWSFADLGVREVNK